MPMVGSKPSISASSWLSVCSRSSLATTAPWPARRWPIASISSMKMIAGDRLRASANRSRTRAAPTPTNISTKLEPVTEKKGTCASPATARASRVLPVPGGPTMSTPRGHHGPGPRVAVGVAQEVDDLADLRLRAVVAGDVVERGGGPLLVEHLGAGPADAEDALHLAGRAAGEPPPEPDDDDERQQDDDPVQQLGAEAGRRGGAGDLHAVRLELIEQGLAGLRRDDHGVVRPVGQRPAARAARLGDGDRLHRVLGHVGEELRVGQARSVPPCAPPGGISRGTARQECRLAAASAATQAGAAAGSPAPACRQVAGARLAYSCGPALSARRAPLPGRGVLRYPLHYPCPGGLCYSQRARIAASSVAGGLHSKLSANARGTPLPHRDAGRSPGGEHLRRAADDAAQRVLRHHHADAGHLREPFRAVRAAARRRRRA